MMIHEEQDRLKYEYGIFRTNERKSRNNPQRKRIQMFRNSHFPYEALFNQVDSQASRGLTRYFILFDVPCRSSHKGKI